MATLTWTVCCASMRQNADVLVFDAQYTPEEHALKLGWGHSTWLEATRVARDCQVGQLVLFHRDQGTTMLFWMAL